MAQEIWLEKYRPKTLDEVYGNTEIVDSLKVCVQHGNFPHLILTGPPGVGKTSTVLCMARMLLGQKEKQAVKELNASDERGIDVVRDEIKTFAGKKVNLPPNRTKIIILDEADSLTEAAQQALRMIISNNGDNTRFVLSCNDSTKIIDPIQSRCVIMRFSKLKENEVALNLKRVIQAEKVKITERALQTLLFISDGDMRQALNNLQACHQSLGLKSQQPITEGVVLDICDAPNIETIKGILYKTIKGDIHEATIELHILFSQGYSTYDIVNNFYKVLVGLEGDSALTKTRLFEMIKMMADLKKRVLEGVGTELQVACYLAKCATLKC